MSARTAFTDDDARRAWNRGAHAWREFVRSGQDYYRLLLHGPALLDLCGTVAGLRVLDLGCGEGYFSRELAGCGADVVGIDITDGLLDAARAVEQADPLGIEFRQLSATDAAAAFGPGQFDLVTACMSLQDMSDSAAALRSAATVLRPTGRMVFSVSHPATETPVRMWQRDQHGEKLALTISGYFDGGHAICEWNMPRLVEQWSTPFWRRTLEDWSSMIADAGFAIRRIREPRPDPAMVASHPQLKDCALVPYFLLLELISARG